MADNNLQLYMEKNLWDFLCAREILHYDEERNNSEQDKNLILEMDRRYLNFTLCACIASIHKYYVSEKNPLFKIENPSDIKEPHEKVLWSLLKLRDECLAHDNHNPFQNMDPIKFQNFSILSSENKLNIGLISETLISTISKCLGFNNTNELIADIKEKNFKNLTQNYYHHRLERYLTTAIQLTNTMENLYGIKASSKEADGIIEGFAITPGLIKDFKTATVRVRNFALHNTLPILSEKELQEANETAWLNDLLIHWYEFLKSEETDEDRKKGTLGERLVQEWKYFKSLPKTKQPKLEVEFEKEFSEYEHEQCHFEPVWKETKAEERAREEKYKEEIKKGNFGITDINKIKMRTTGGRN